MKNASRTKATRIAEKLLRIRVALNLSQSGMHEHLGFSEELFRSNVSQYELGTREPPLPVILSYAQAAGVWVDVLIDDEIDLPKKLPSIRVLGVRLPFVLRNVRIDQPISREHRRR